MDPKTPAPEKPAIYYTVKIEALVPATLVYKVWAKDAEEALRLAIQHPGRMSEPPKLQLNRWRKIGATVVKWGQTLLELSKKF